MAAAPVLRSRARQRQAAAAEDVCGLLEGAVAESDLRVCRSQEELQRQRKVLDAVFNCQVVLHRGVIQQMIVVEEVQQEGSLNQQDPKAPLHIKEEEEQPLISSEGERFPFPPVSVKSEEDEEEAQPPQLQQSQTEEDSGRPEPATSLRALVKQRLAEAVEEILELFETTLAEYEDEIHHLHSLLEHVKPGFLSSRADERKKAGGRDRPQVCEETATDPQQTVDVPGMDRVDRLAEYLVGLRAETGQTLSSQQASTIIALWQNLLPHDKQQVRPTTGGFGCPQKKPADVENCVLASTGSPAQRPDCCRLVDSIFVKLCNIHKSPQKQGSYTLTRWTLILRDYSKIMQLVLGNGSVMQSTTLRLFPVSQTTLIQWRYRRLKRQDCSTLLRGGNLPASIPVAPVQVRPPAAPPQPGPQHQCRSPQSTAGQAAVKRKSAAPPPPHAPPSVRPRLPAQRKLFPKQAPPPASAPVPVLLNPTPAIGPFVFLAPQIPAAKPAAPAGTLPPPPAARRAYNRTVDKNKCSQCHEPRNKETGHSQYYGRVYCPRTAGEPLERWMDEMRRKRRENTRQALSKKC
ncbi:uncharacterized protein LOC122885854 [Siniperca chuatsi]|uniref:uncharacterized protein LOC122885854 n=1 Tax=Siniperca chuatsi TaxID=119488 RepID=UPI001CE0DDBC|nr:uncharacterized protein LOC122885854 [Siniperca chuatsi]